MGSKHFFITGCTGFIGANLATSLLRQGHTITALVRGESRSRLYLALNLADPSKFWNKGQLNVLTGDLMVPDLGLRDGDLEGLQDVDQIIHCAGNAAFDNLRSERFHVNVFGTENVCGLTELLDIEKFVYLSTNTVFGTQTGQLPEVAVPEGASFHNAYEKSNAIAEGIVLNRCRGKSTIIRPAICIQPFGAGNESSIPVTWTKVYAFAQGLYAMKQLLGIPPEGEVDFKNAILLPGSSGPLNMVPIDSMIEMIKAVLFAKDTAGKIFHATHPIDVMANEVIDTFLKELGFRNYRLTHRFAELKGERHPLGRRNLDSLGFFSPFVDIDRTFVACNMDAIYDRSKIPRIDYERARHMIQTAVRYCFGQKLPDAYNQLRVHRRADVAIPLSIGHGNYFEIATTVNLSGTGMCLESRNQYQIGDRLTANFRIPEAPPFHCPGEVRWVTATKEAGVFRVGVAFKSMPKEQVDLLDAFVIQRLNGTEPGKPIGDWAYG